MCCSFSSDLLSYRYCYIEIYKHSKLDPFTWWSVVCDLSVDEKKKWFIRMGNAHRSIATAWKSAGAQSERIYSVRRKDQCHNNNESKSNTQIKNLFFVILWKPKSSLVWSPLNRCSDFRLSKAHVNMIALNY